MPAGPIRTEEHPPGERTVVADEARPLLHESAPAKHRRLLPTPGTRYCAHRVIDLASGADLLEIGVDAVGVKATTNEKLGWIGRGEGMAALAVVLLQRK